MNAPLSLPGLAKSKVQATAAAFGVGLALLTSFGIASAQSEGAQRAAAPVFAASSSSSTLAKKIPVAAPKNAVAPKSGWLLLSAEQQRALQPLASTWDSLSEGQRRKWLEISRNYPSLSGADKARLHSRMSEWVALSAQARANARLNFAATSELSKELTPAEKKAKWEAYQSLSAEEKKKFAESGAKTPQGAAPATRPVAQRKLTTLAPANDAGVKPSKVVPPSRADETSTGPAESTNLSPAANP
jgi:hypothetical protein